MVDYELLRYVISGPPTTSHMSCGNRHKSEYTPTIIYIKYIQIKRGVINQIDYILLFMTIIKI